LGKRIVITGGAGFIGSAVADLFVEAGWDVVVLDDLSSGKRENVPAAARFYPVDVRSAAAAEAIARERPQVICHHAAQIDVRRSMADPRFDADVNVGGLLNLMQAAVRAGSVEHVLFASSGGATYGDTDRIPTPEEHPQRPVSHYGAAKASSVFTSARSTFSGVPSMACSAPTRSSARTASTNASSERSSAGHQSSFTPLIYMERACRVDIGSCHDVQRLEKGHRVVIVGGGFGGLTGRRRRDPRRAAPPSPRCVKMDA